MTEGVPLIRAFCPSCGARLAKVPARKTKCPSCGGFIYLKRLPWEGEKRIVCEEEAVRIEAVWSARAAQSRIDETAVSVALPRGLTEDQLVGHLRSLVLEGAARGEDWSWPVSDPIALSMKGGIFVPASDISSWAGGKAHLRAMAAHALAARYSSDTEEAGKWIQLSNELALISQQERQRASGAMSAVSGWESKVPRPE